MILSQFASRSSGLAPSPSTYSKRVGLGDGVAKWLKRAILLWRGVLQLPQTPNPNSWVRHRPS